MTERAGELYPARHAVVELAIRALYAADDDQRDEAAVLYLDVLASILREHFEAGALYAYARTSAAPIEQRVSVSQDYLRELAAILGRSSSRATQTARVAKVSNALNRALLQRDRRGTPANAKIQAAALEALGVREVPEDARQALASVTMRALGQIAQVQARGAYEAAIDAARRGVGPPGLRFVTMRDERVRRNHARAEGLVAHAADPAWLEILPPIGYGCRCRVEPVTARELARRGLARLDGSPSRYVRIPRGAFRDPGYDVVTDFASPPT